MSDYLSYFNRYTQSVHVIMHINKLYKICLSIFWIKISFEIVDLKSNVFSAPHNDWLYRNLIRESHFQKNFPIVYKTYGETVQSKSCLIHFA